MKKYFSIILIVFFHPTLLSQLKEKHEVFNVRTFSSQLWTKHRSEIWNNPDRLASLFIQDIKLLEPKYKYAVVRYLTTHHRSPIRYVGGNDHSYSWQQAKLLRHFIVNFDGNPLVHDHLMDIFFMISNENKKKKLFFDALKNKCKKIIYTMLERGFYWPQYIKELFDNQYDNDEPFINFLIHFLDQESIEAKY